MDKVVDEKGLVKVNEVLTVHLPAIEAIIPLRVVNRLNKGFETFEYGPLPVSFSGFPAGVIPAATVTPEFTFSYTRLLPEIAPDMWYFTDANKIFHAHLFIEPAKLLRVSQRIPSGTTPWMFRNVVASPDLLPTIEFGFFRGYKEQIFLPNIKIGWVVANPTNINLRTYARFVYGEYQTEAVKDAQLIWDIMTGRVASHFIQLGGPTPIPSETLRLALRQLDAKAIKLLPKTLSRDEAVAKISEMLVREVV